MIGPGIQAYAVAYQNHAIVVSYANSVLMICMRNSLKYRSKYFRHVMCILKVAHGAQLNFLS